MATRRNNTAISSSLPNRKRDTIRRTVTECTDEKKDDSEYNVTARNTQKNRSRPSQTRNVQFVRLTIREYPIEIGDNPGTTKGPSLSMGWMHLSEQHVSVDDYETRRPHRRSGREMIIPSEMRFGRLREAGFSRREINVATRPVNITRSQRRRTLETLQLQPLQEAHEKLARKTLNVLTLGKKKKLEKKLLEEHLRAVDDSMHSFSMSESMEQEDLEPIVFKTQAVSPLLRRNDPPTVSSVSSSDSEVLA